MECLFLCLSTRAGTINYVSRKTEEQQRAEQADHPKSSSSKQNSHFDAVWFEKAG
jgi:hypothetical protein